MKAWHRSTLAYALAVASSAAALGGEVALRPRLPQLSPLFLFYAAVALSSWYGGTGPGLLAVGLSAAAASYLVLGPIGYFHIVDPSERSRLVLFILVGVLIASLNGQLRTSRSRCDAEAQAARRAEVDLRAHQEQLQALASQLLRAEELERRRIAAVLHDSVGANLALAKRKLEALRGSIAATQSPASLQDVEHLINDAVRHTRSLTSEISPPVLYELGLVQGLHWLADQFLRQHGLSCQVEDDGRPKPVSGEVRLVLFQAVRELLLNVVKHARARSCCIQLSRNDDSINVVVLDDGAGFDPSYQNGVAVKTDGFGLFNIRERLSFLRGTMEVRSLQSSGTRVTLTAPLLCDPTIPANEGATDANPCPAC